MRKHKAMPKTFLYLSSTKYTLYFPKNNQLKKHPEPPKREDFKDHRNRENAIFQARKVIAFGCRFSPLKQLSSPVPSQKVHPET